MKEKRVLCALGSVNDKYIDEMYAPAEAHEKHINHLPGKRMWLVAAIIALMLFLMGSAIVIMSLDKLSMGTENINVPIDHHNSVTEDRTTLSLQGFLGTPGYQAAMEWNQFLDTYDPDHSILASLPDDKNTGIPAEYESYTCYTQEMKAKIDEICAKYGLEILGKIYTEETNEEFFAALGVDTIIAENANAKVELYPEYYYKDGTFDVFGLTTLNGENNSWQFPVEFGMRCVMKSSFDAVTANVKDPNSFAEWTYTLADGTEVLLALSNEGALIVADRTDCFITIRLETTVQKWYMDEPMTMDKATLEAFADTFDLTFQPQRPDIAAAEAREEARYQEYLKRQEEQNKVNDAYYGKASYAERIRYNIEEEYHSDRYGYALMDLDGNGVAELLIGQDGWFNQLYTMNGETTEALIDPVSYFASSEYYLCEGNVIAKVNTPYRYEFGKVAGTQIVWDVILEHDEYNYPEHPWRKIRYDGNIRVSEAISESEFNRIIQSYKRIVVDTKPLAEYPQDTTVKRDPNKMYPHHQFADFEELVLAYLDTNAGDEYRFALLDFDGDGQDELILYELAATGVYTMTDGVFNKIISGYELTVCEDNILEKVVRYSDNTYAVCYYRIVNGNQTEMIEYLRYDADRDPSNPWFRSTDASGFDETLVPVTESQFERIMNSYTDIGLKMKPLSEYPFAE